MRWAARQIRVRQSRVEDVEGIRTLMSQLGYDVATPEIAERLGRRQERREVFVAMRAEDVVGWAAVCADEPFVEGFGAHLEGLVVEESMRSLGIGARLIAAVEGWARERGCAEIRVQSNVVRERAHAFYQGHGYVTIKAQYHLRKSL